MSISKIFLFAKNTDAVATEQGFQYQRLKTIKTWVENRINETDEIIYCDYEDDIFERNLEKGEVRFRQLKLYATNFSFAKIEVQKSLFHFFMLFAKGDYLFDNPTFVFETNASVAKAVGNNEAALLKEWAENQGQLSDDLLSRCKTKVKEILDEYIKEAYNQASDGSKSQEFAEAKSLYDNLPDETWNHFIRSIEWRFEGVDRDDAIQNLVKELEDLIPKLPLPLELARSTSYISLLHYEVANRTAATDKDDKSLSNQLMDSILLSEGSEQNRWYGEVHSKWAAVAEVVHFNVGAFYEVVSAARHCRWEISSTAHRQLWREILGMFINNDETIIACKRKAIYESLFLKMAPNPGTYEPTGNLYNNADLIRYYFSEFEHRNSLADVEEDIIFLEIVEVQNLLAIASGNEKFLTTDEINEWRDRLNNLLEYTIAHPATNDELCLAHELKGHHLFHNHPETPLDERVVSSINAYSKIIPLLTDAKVYSISKLSDQLNQILNLLIEFGIAGDSSLRLIEEFMADIEDRAGQLGRRHESAHALVKRGITYLNKPSAAYYLKALECFHKAKDLWFIDQTAEGYTLALINIAQVYTALGMNLAAKYYALCGVWASVHFGNYSVLKRISDGYAMVFHADFQQGAWMSALDDFKKYITTRLEFKAGELSFTSEIFGKTAIDLAIITLISERKKPELTVFINPFKSSLGWVFEQYVNPVFDELEKREATGENIETIVEAKVHGEVLNDLGPVRTLSFNALGIEWKIVFDNTARLNSIGEEFAAQLQIALCEIGLHRIDLHLLPMTVEVFVREGHDHKAWITQRPSHEKSIWDLSIPAFNAKDNEAAIRHFAFVATNVRTLLSNISVLKDDEFYQLYDATFMTKEAINKGFATHVYQKVYFNLLSEEEFNASRRGDFGSVQNLALHSNRPGFLPLFDGLSSKYDQATSLKHIEARYKKTKALLSKSLAKWLTSSDFQNLVRVYRSQGWLDWQILLAFMNYTLSIQAEENVKGIPGLQPEQIQALRDKEYARLLRLDEEEDHREITVDQLLDPFFSFFLQKTPTDTLRSFGLQNGMKHPNFAAVRTLLEKRFRFGEDDVPEQSPFRSI